MTDMNSTYIGILSDTLRRKLAVLEELSEITARQSKLLAEEELDIDAFGDTVTLKEEQLEKLNSLDDGFMDIYNKVAEEMKANPNAYKDKILEARGLIRSVTELSTGLMAAEERNHTAMSIHMTKGRRKVKDFKVSSKTAAAYYKNMSGKHREGDSYFFSQKK